MPVEFPVRPQTSAEADETKAAYEAAILAIEYPDMVVKKTPLTVYFVPLIPTALEAAYDAGDADKKFNMAVISQTTLNEAPPDYNARYTELYNEAYP